MADLHDSSRPETGNFVLNSEPDSDEMASDDELIATLDLIEKIEKDKQNVVSGSNLPVLEVLVPAMAADDDVPKESASKPNQPRFPTLEDDQLESLIANTNSIHTDKMTKWGVTVFVQWLSQRGYDKQFETKDPPELDIILKRFYAEIRNAQGEHYSRSTFVGIRAAINRHLRSPPHNKEYSILKDQPFPKSNQMFKAMLKVLKREGNDKTKHYTAISDADLIKLRSSGVLSDENPRALQRKVWFDFSISFARRGRENLSDLKYDCFVFTKDDDGFECVEMAYNEATKNHQGDNLKDCDHQFKPRMYATNDENCPVASLHKYLAKRNKGSDHLFQQPRAHVNENDEIWYTTRPIGTRTLNDMMKTISSEAGLSKMYTNHCVRATTITRLSHAGVETKEIMKISGHRNEASVRSYNTDSSDSQKRAYSSIIHNNNTTGQPAIKSQHREITPFTGNSQLPPSPAPVQHLTSNVNQSVFQYHQLPNNVLHQKQFEITNSSVHVHNYYGCCPK